ncbi:MAG: DUF1573 domain-containing protein [Rikenellaceae bacterium]
MARLLIVSLFFLSVVSCKVTADVEQKQESATLGVITFPDTLCDEITSIRELNLGVVREGETISGRLNFKNPMDSTITISSFKGSCGCMDITEGFTALEKEQIKSINYRIHTTDKSGEEYFDIIVTTSIGKFMVEMVATVK